MPGSCRGARWLGRNDDGVDAQTHRPAHRVVSRVRIRTRPPGESGGATGRHALHPGPEGAPGHHACGHSVGLLDNRSGRWRRPWCRRRPRRRYRARGGTTPPAGSADQPGRLRAAAGCGSGLDADRAGPPRPGTGRQRHHGSLGNTRDDAGFRAAEHAAERAAAVQCARDAGARGFDQNCCAAGGTEPAAAASAGLAGRRTGTDTATGTAGSPGQQARTGDASADVGCAAVVRSAAASHRRRGFRRPAL